MLSIGDFARHGRVSVRMLRHYDAIGLLKPAFVDQVTGYRSYEARQLSRLNRIVALKGLGFTLQQVRSVLDDEVSVEELRGMLRLRHAELQSQIETDTARLAQVEARLQIIEREGTMPADEVQIKRIPGLRVAELTGTAAGFEPESIAPVIGPLYDELRDRLDRAGLAPAGPDLAYYEDSPDGDGVLVHATIPVSADPGEDHDFAIVDLPEVEQAATILHRGSMDNVMPTIQALARWIDANGYRPVGYNRELGRGFDLEAMSPGSELGKTVGIARMREWALLLGGQLDIHTKPGRGTSVVAKVPLPAHEGSIRSGSETP